MNGTAAWIAVAAFAFQWGYEPADDGTVEYHLQLTPHELRNLLEEDGAQVVSYIPDQAQPVGRVRISSGHRHLVRRPLSTTDKESPSTESTVERSVLKPVPQDDLTTPVTVLQPVNYDRLTGGDRYPAATPGGNRVDPMAPESPPHAVSAEAQGQGDRIVIPGTSIGNRRPDRDMGPQFPLDSRRASLARSAESVENGVPSPGGPQPVRSGLPGGAAEHYAGLPRSEPPARERALVSFPPTLAMPESQPPEQPNANRATIAVPASSLSDETDALPPGTAEQPVDSGAGDKPWLPLFGAIGIAFGFLAGNLFQWRSYLSLRKRYLHLLRKTGG